MKKIILTKILCAALAGLAVSVAAKSYNVLSPNGKLTLSFDYSGSKVTYSLSREFKTIIKDSPISAEY